jgi:hypothetical protein
LQADDLPLDYSSVTQSKTGRVGPYLIRYLVFPDAPCLIFESSMLGAPVVSKESRICSYKENEFFNGYAFVDILDGHFSNGKLFLRIEFTPLRSSELVLELCEVRFSGEEAVGLFCGEDRNGF